MNDKNKTIDRKIIKISSSDNDSSKVNENIEVIEKFQIKNYSFMNENIEPNKENIEEIVNLGKIENIEKSLNHKNVDNNNESIINENNENHDNKIKNNDDESNNNNDQNGDVDEISESSKNSYYEIDNVDDGEGFIGNFMFNIFLR